MKSAKRKISSPPAKRGVADQRRELERVEGYVTVMEASREVHFSKPVIYTWARAGLVRSRKVGLTRVYVHLEDVRRVANPPAAQVS